MTDTGRRDTDRSNVLTFRWLAGAMGGIVLVVVLGLLSLVWNGQVQTVQALERRVDALALVQTNQAAEVAGIKAQLSGMERQLARIEGKIDQMSMTRPSSFPGGSAGGVPLGAAP